MSPIDLGPCRAPSCGRQGTRRTPTLRWPVCDGHYERSPDSPVIRYCSCGEPALLPGQWADMCSNHIADAHRALGQLINELQEAL